MLTKEELDQINRFSKAELTADQVYTFSVRLCDNEVDRDFERFGTPGHVQNGAAVRPFLLLKKNGPVRRSHQAVGAGNHFKLVVCLLLSGVVYQQEADAAIIGKAFQLTHHLVIVGVAVLIPTSLPDFLESVNDNQLGVRVFPDELL